MAKLIDKQDAINICDKYSGYMPRLTAQRVWEEMKGLPHVKPEQKTAMWLIHKWGDDAKCSNCGHTFKDVYDMDNHDGFCRFCGSKMIGIKGVNI